MACVQEVNENKLFTLLTQQIFWIVMGRLIRKCFMPGRACHGLHSQLFPLSHAWSSFPTFSSFSLLTVHLLAIRGEIVWKECEVVYLRMLKNNSMRFVSFLSKHFIIAFLVSTWVMFSLFFLLRWFGCLASKFSLLNFVAAAYLYFNPFFVSFLRLFFVCLS